MTHRNGRMKTAMVRPGSTERSIPGLTPGSSEENESLEDMSNLRQRVFARMQSSSSLKYPVAPDDIDALLDGIEGPIDLDEALEWSSERNIGALLKFEGEDISEEDAEDDEDGTVYKKPDATERTSSEYSKSSTSNELTEEMAKMAVSGPSGIAVSRDSMIQEGTGPSDSGTERSMSSRSRSKTSGSSKASLSMYLSKSERSSRYSSGERGLTKQGADVVADLRRDGDDSFVDIEGKDHDDLSDSSSVLSDMTGMSCFDKSGRATKSQERYQSVPKHQPAISFKPKPTKSQRTVTFSVSFESVHIRSYERIMSDNPASTGGPSLGIGWNYEEDDAWNLDEYEDTREGKRDPQTLRLSRRKREALVRTLGYSEKEIATTVRQVNKVRFQRRQTVVNLGASKLEEAAEKAKRKLRRLLVGEKS